MTKNQRRELQGKHVKRLMAAPPDSVRRRWKRWLLGRLSGEVAELFRHIEIYESLVAMVKVNDALLEPPVFFIWLKNSYVTAIAMGIRRQLDCDPRSVSLGILLREAELRHSLISRKCFRAMMRRKGLTPEEADGDLRRRIGSTTFKVAMATADIRRLERAENRIRRLVNKRIAHTGLLSEMRKPPTFDEIKKAVEEIDKVYVKYDAIIAGGGLTTARVTMLDWSRVLAIPWRR